MSHFPERFRRPAIGVRSLIQAAWQTSRWRTTFVAGLLVLEGTFPVFFILGSATLVSAVIEPGRETGSGNAAIAWAAALAAAYVTLQLIQPIRQYLSAELGDGVDKKMRHQLIFAATSPPTIEHLHNQKIASTLESLNDALAPGSVTPGTYGLPSLVNIVLIRLRGLSVALVLATVSSWSALALIAAWMIASQLLKADLNKLVDSIGQSNVERQQGSYMRDLALRPKTAKEVHVFRMRDYLRKQFEHYCQEATRVARRSRDNKRVGVAAVILLVAHIVVLGSLLSRAAEGQLGFEQFVIATQAVVGLVAAGGVRDDHWKLRHVTGTVAMLGDIAPGSVAPKHRGNHEDRPIPVEEIRLERVSFAYPNSSPVLRDLSLVIRRGESLAIVGHNGAGKTTILNLLAGLYLPDQGRITVNGMNLREIDVGLWRRQLAFCFQDFLRYDLSVLDNITIGRPRSPDVLDQAIGLGGLKELLEHLPMGGETPLNSAYEGGVDLAGGEWQKVCLSRALYALGTGAEVLVLDEPTASLDAMGEGELFSRLLEAAQEATVILVSHRFSTVRRADRIVVLQDGSITEQGSHLELMQGGGLYAHFFLQQASRYNASSPLLFGPYR